ncbi:hypothetical protein CPLU01_11264 [Colletotrichum plurivorum]|uniref:NmrA-like domain-containing protein n=1 Tax=Colletotrichum plurivorum TaxID=2175906 RepID=A0A8H6K2K1_9PEZI|nr:hypothetical protein CPLU01_11264 [Colletotrichum plurivorum]
MPPKPIFVAGATGTVGGAVAKHLLATSTPVVALARDPSSPAAKHLTALGAVLTKGGFDDDSALEEAMSNGIAGVFLNFMPDFVDHEWELRTALRILSFAKRAGATHAIYSSGFAVQAPERLSHWDPESFTAKVLLSKQSIEGAVRSAGFDAWTILRPGNFATNYVLPQVSVFPDLVTTGRYITALKPDTRLPTLDPDDIGAFAAAAYADPGRFGQKEIPISAEMLTPGDIMGKLARFTGKDIQAVYLSDEEVEAQKDGNPFLAGQLAAQDMDQFADQDDTESWGVPLTTFDGFLERERERVTETYAQLA